MRRSHHINCILLAWASLHPAILPAQDLSGKTAGMPNLLEQRSAFVHLTFQQPEYAAGDTSFFRADLVQRGTWLPVRGAHIINLRLLDNGNNEVTDVRVLTTDGAGVGYLVLPGDRKPGIYTLQAFTDEMILNKDTASFLQLPFLITGREKIALRAIDKVLIRPEGNHFVAGVPNRIVVQSTTPFVGDVVDSDGNILTAGLSSDKSGWANFTLSPDAGKKYFLRIDKSMHLLQEPEVDGVAVEILPQNDAGHYLLKANAPKTGIWFGQNVQVVVWSGGAAQTVGKITPGASVPLAFKVLSEGINRLTLISDKGELIAERLFYNPIARSVEVDASMQGLPGTREVVPVDIVVRDEQGMPVNGAFSISVYSDEMFADDDGDDALHTFQIGLQSELGVPGNDAPVESGLWNDYLVVHYKETIHRKATRLKASPYYFKAKVFYAESRLPVPDSTMVTFYLNRYDVIFMVPVREGSIEFPLFMNFGDDEVYYRVTFEGKTTDGVRVVPDSQPTVVPPEWNGVALDEVDHYGDFAGVRKKVDQSYSFYDENQKMEDADEGISEDWNVDSSVDLEKFIPFADVAETLKEVIPAVNVRRQDGQSNIRVFMKETAQFSSEPPVFIIDGTMTDSAAYLLSLDPKKLSRIGVIRSAKKMARYGAIGKGGIIMVESKGRVYHDEVPRSSHMFHVTGIQKPVAFSSPAQSADPLSRVPDLRPVLYWDPTLVLKNGKASIICHTSDLSGKFKIRIAGFSDKGVFIRADTTFEVKFSKP